jgi:serine/threonine protein kinase
MPHSSSQGASLSEQTYVGGRRNSAAESASRQSPNDASEPIEILHSHPAPSGPTVSEQDSRDLARDLESKRYEIREEIGRGGCGVVLRAFDRVMQRDVVIKRIFANNERSKEVTSRFLNEAIITGRLEHPGIVPVHEIGRSENGHVPYYVMKWLQGETLQQVIRQFHETKPSSERQRKQRELLVRFHQVCQTLAYAHRLQIIHRDLKPANIMIGQFGETIVLDWGLAKELKRGSTGVEQPAGSYSDPTAQLGQGCDAPSRIGSQQGTQSSTNKRASQSDAALTRLGSVMGTAAYMSPEQARGELDKVDCRSDVFALGVILYEILAGTSPFRSNSVDATLQMVVRGEFKDLREVDRHVPRTLEAICHRAMQRERDDRYADASELAADIEDYLAGNPVTAFREPWWFRVDRIATKHSALVRTAFVAMFAIAMLSVLAAARIDGSRRSEVAARMLAEQESLAKRDALTREQSAHRHSLEQLQAARKATDAWLIDLSGELQFYPGLESIREQLLDKASDYYRAHIDSADSSPAEQIEVARDYLRLGDIARLQNSRDQAFELYTSAEQTLSLLSLETGHELQVARQLQQANAALGKSLCSLEDPDANELGLQFASKAAELAAPFVDSQPDLPDAQKTWIRSQQLIARCLANKCEYLQAANTLERPASIAGLLDAQLSDSSSLHLLASLISERAAALQKANQWEPAAEILQQLITIYSHRMREHGERPDWLESRSNAYLQLGKCKALIHKPKASLSDLESSASDIQASWKLMYDSPFYRESIAVANANLGKAFFSAGDLLRSEGMLRTSIAQLQDLVKRYGTNSDRIARMANLFLSLATTIEGRRDLNSQSEFTRLLKDSSTLLQHIDSTTPANHQRSLHTQWCLLNAKHKANDQHWQETLDFIDQQWSDLAPVRITADDASADGLAMMELKRIRLKCLWELGEDESAACEFKSLVDEYRHAWVRPDGQINLFVAISFLQCLCESQATTQTDWQRAAEVADRLVVIGSQHPLAWHYAALAYWRNGQTQLASDAIQQAKQLRWRPALEDDVLSDLIHDVGNPGASATNWSQRYAGEPRHDWHLDFLIDRWNRRNLHGN